MPAAARLRPTDRWQIRIQVVPADADGCTVGRAWFRPFLWSSFAVLVVDQGTKAAARHLGPDAIAHNDEYALQLIGGARLWLIAGTIVVMAAFVAVVSWLGRHLRVPPLFPALVVGGMVGNVVDRVRLGAVRDFLVTPWAICNVADVAIAVGIVVFAVACAAGSWERRTFAAHGI